MQTCSELERKAVPAQGGHLQSEPRDIDLLLAGPGQGSSASLQQDTGHPDTPG